MRRAGFAIAISIAFGLLLGLEWKSGLASVLVRTTGLGLVAVLAFSALERWPRRLPRGVARWALQVAAVGLSMPLATLVIYAISTPAGAPPFWEDSERVEGVLALSVLGAVVAPTVALAAVVREKEVQRREMERQAVDARLHLLQAQVAPHFLFNTLANIQALVDAGSPQASALLRSLIAYLRAAVPLLNEPTVTIGQEVQLARAYLELMHMRMPDRLAFDVRAEHDALTSRCPPTTLLTLVENAVRHGIDPSEEGGRIDVEVKRDRNR